MDPSRTPPPNPSYEARNAPEPAYERRTGMGVYYILGAIAVLLLVIFWIVSASGPAPVTTPAPAGDTTAPAPLDPAADPTLAPPATDVPATDAPAMDAPATDVTPAPEPAPAD